MSNLFQKLGKTRTPTAAASSGPRLTLAAFGKHPGWDDHMPGIGLETETLVHIKQTLYVTGIGRQIDSGAWEKLEPDKRQEGFDHTFLWLRAGHLALGQLWSSKDGKGRSKYPMVLCVDSERVSPSLLLNKVRPGLEALRDACKGTTMAEQVASNCRVAQEQLRILFAGNALPPDPPQPGDDPNRFLERAELGPDRLGLLRVLHELGGSFATTSDTRAHAEGGGAPTPSLHLRVPLAADSQNSALLLWAEFLRSALYAEVPLILMARGQADWLDVVVGEPKADDFFFLQASQKGFPLATEIPYELAPDARTRLREIEIRFRGAEPAAPETAPKVSPPAPPPAAKVAPPSPPPTVTAAPPRPPPVAAPPPAAAPAPKVAPPAPSLAATIPSPTPASAPKTAPPASPPPAKVAPQSASPTPPRAQDSAPPSKRSPMLAIGVVVVVLIVAVLALLPHGKNEDGKHFDQMLADGKQLLGEKKYDEAIHDFEEADKARPQDDQVKQLLAQARGQRDSAALASRNDADYQTAMKNAGDSSARGDFTTALAEAGKALSIKPTDAAAKQLHDESQAKLTALAQTTQKEADYQTAMKNGRQALERGDYTSATAEAGKAISLKPEDGDAHHLRDETQAKLRTIELAARQESDYQTAMKNGKDLLVRRDYSTALTEAGTALSLKPGDVEAKQLRDDAQTQLDAVALSTQKEADYRAAMKNGNLSFANGDYTNASAEAAKALALKPDDADAAKLRDDAKRKQAGVHPQFRTNSINMVFVWVPGIAPSGAYIGKYEVTEKQFQEIMADTTGAPALTDANLPMAGITFQQAAKFCEELSKKENERYSIPTMQQWLTAAGLSEDKVTNAWNILSASGALEHEATSLDRHPARTKPVPVGSMGAPANGVCDMFGNVREWVSEQKRAGFSYRSTGVGRTGELFLPGPVPDDSWIEEETGLRCLLQTSQPP